jgi:hypothetical protein
MGQQFPQWRSGDGERLWLSMLVATMERMSSRDFHGEPCDQTVLGEVQAHLARAAWRSADRASQFSLRN